MNKRSLFAIIFTVVLSSAVSAQRPPRPQGPPPPGGGQMMPAPGQPPRVDWTKAVDTNRDGKIDAAELQAGIDSTFTDLDKNANGTIDAGEANFPPMGPMGPPNGGMGQRPPRPGQPDAGMRPQGAPRGPEPDKRLAIPPFFFMERVGRGDAVTRADFDQAVKAKFAEMDTDKDGTLDREEARPPRAPDAPAGPQGPPMPPNAKFIGAELRFGDKLVKGQPFSAEMVIEDTRRLYDGTTVTKQNKGAVYRDGQGRTRREQPLEMVGGVGIVGSDNKPQVLVFINDFASRTQIFLDGNNKVARKGQIGGGQGPKGPGEPADAKSESLGTKMIEGISAEGTRVTFEIPAGQIGNSKPIQVVTERWYSPELQVLVMSRHLDPVAGEHLFKLVNIKRAEPAADMFSIPAGYRIETPRDRVPEMQ